MAKKIYIDKRTSVNGKSSAINNDNKLDLNNHIQTIITETVTTPTATEIPFDNTVTGDLFATTVQDAIDEFSWLAVEWQYATVNVSSFELTNNLGAGIQLLPALINAAYVYEMTLVYNHGGVNYGVGLGADLLVGGKTYPINFFSASSSRVLFTNSEGQVYAANQPILIQTSDLSNLSGAGNGTLTVNIKYKTIPL